MTRIEEAIDRLVRAYLTAGGSAAEFDPATAAELDALRQSVAPQLLPREMTVLWGTFQELGVPGIIDTNPLCRVETAIGAQGHTFQSRALLSIGSGGRARCFLELDDAGGSGGGAVWTCEEFSPEMREAAPSLAALLDATATAWERGIVRLSEAHPFPWAAWDEAAWARLKAELLPRGRIAGSRPSGWLPRWLAAEGLIATDVVPRGPSSTIDALLAKGDAWRTAETVRGRVVSLVGANASGATLDDGTGRITVYVPPGVDSFALVRFHGDIELDVERFPPNVVVEPPFDADAFDAVARSVRDA